MPGLCRSGCSIDQVVKITSHLKDSGDFDGYNEVYQTYFNKPFPARITVQSVIPGGALLEIEAMVVFKGKLKLRELLILPLFISSTTSFYSLIPVDVV